jgi:hypothetical protein
MPMPPRLSFTSSEMHPEKRKQAKLSEAIYILIARNSLALSSALSNCCRARPLTDVIYSN